MATKLQTYTTASDSANNRITNENATFYSRTLLEALKEKVLLTPYGTKKPIPKNSGATISCRRLEMPTSITTAITEGTTPDGIDATVNVVTGTVAQYGAWTKYSDYIDTVGLDPIVTETAKMFGEHAAISIDAIIMGVLNAGTNRQFAGAKTARSTMVNSATCTMDADELLLARKTMVSNQVPQIKLPNGKKGYLAFANPTVINQLMKLDEWKAMNTYVDTSNYQEGIVGQMYGIYFMESNIAPTFADGGTATYTGNVTPIIGDGAFAVADVDGSMAPEIIVTDQADSNNPLGLTTTVGWKSLFTAFILNQKCVLCLETLNA
jgi:N4-gp56 family major capsid protein